MRAQTPATASSTTASAPTEPASAGSTVTGRVLCADTQRPARFAQVNLIPATEDGDGGGRGGGRLGARTDLEGNFSLGGVAPGDYYVAGQLPGYVNVTQQVQAALNAGGDTGTALAGVPLVHVGADGGTADVSLQRGGVIAGVVVWDDGSPANGVGISAQPVTTGVQSTSAPQNFGAGFGRNGGPAGGFGGGQTDDRGRFRLSGLMPGSYAVRASVQAPLPGKASTRGFEPLLTVAVYAPDKYRRSEAIPVTLTGGEERDDLNITLSMAGMHSVSGTVSSTGGTVRGGSISLTDSSDSSLSRTGIINADGSFTVPYVPAGSYTLQASASSQATGNGGGRGGSVYSGGSGGPQFQPLQVAVTVTGSDVAGLSLNVTTVTAAQ